MYPDNFLFSRFLFVFYQGDPNVPSIFKLICTSVLEYCLIIGNSAFLDEMNATLYGSSSGPSLFVKVVRLRGFQYTKVLVT